MLKSLSIVAVFLLCAAPPTPAQDYTHGHIPDSVVTKLALMSAAVPADWKACLTGTIRSDTLIVTDVRITESGICSLEAVGVAIGLSDSGCRKSTKAEAAAVANQLQRDFDRSTDYVRIVMCSPTRYIVLSRPTRGNVPRATPVRT